MIEKMEKFNLIPHPKKIRARKGAFVFDNDTILVSKENDIKTNFAGTDFIDRVKKRYKVAHLVKIDSSFPHKKKIIIAGNPRKWKLLKDLLQREKICLPSSLGDEGYLIDIKPERIVLSGFTDKAIYYAFGTLFQLLSKEGRKLVVPHVYIEDYPTFSWRGYSDDISRGQISNLKHFKRIIRKLSEYKKNVYMLYIEDMFRLKSHPVIGAERGALEKEEVEEIVNYGKKYYVDIIPIFNSLGHNENLLKLPQYAHLARTSNKFCLDPEKKAVREYLTDCYNEVIPSFPSRFFHIGCDETMDIKAEERNVFVKHILWLHSILRRSRKTMIMYYDGFANYYGVDSLQKIPKDTIIVNWNYAPVRNFPYVDAVKDEGFQQLASPGLNSWCKFSPDLKSALNNIYNFSAAAEKKEMLGVVTSSWCDSGAENFRELNWYPLIFSAECAWNGKKAKVVHFDRRFQNIFYGFFNKEFKELTHFLSLEKHEHLNLWHWYMMEPSHMINFIKRNPSFVKEIHNLISKAGGIVDMLTDYHEKVKYERKHLEHYIFAAHQIRHILERFAGLKKVDYYIKNKSPGKAQEVLEKVAADFKRLEKWHLKLWLDNNKKAGSEVMLKRYRNIHKSLLNYLKDLKRDREVSRKLAVKSAQGKYIFLPMEKIANSSFKVCYFLPTGLRYLAGIPFKIIEPEKSNDNACLVLFGQSMSDYPEQKEIEVGKKGKRIYFLHTAFKNTEEVVAQYIVYYDNNTKEIVDVQGGNNIGDWFDPHRKGYWAGGDAWKIDPVTTKLAWLGPDIENKRRLPVAGAYYFTWDNPYPHKKIEKIIFMSMKKETSVIIFAVTLEE